MIFSHVKISMISLTSGLSLKLYLNSLLYHRNIFRSSLKVFGNLRKSSEIFGNSRKMFGNIRLVFMTILENLRKSSESGRKSSENRHKRRYELWTFYTNKRKVTCMWSLGDKKFIVSRWKTVFNSRRQISYPVSYRFYQFFTTRYTTDFYKFRISVWRSHVVSFISFYDITSDLKSLCSLYR